MHLEGIKLTTEGDHQLLIGLPGAALLLLLLCCAVQAPCLAG
jgi:hypothetical protein